MSKLKSWFLWEGKKGENFKIIRLNFRSHKLAILNFKVNSTFSPQNLESYQTSGTREMYCLKFIQLIKIYWVPTTEQRPSEFNEDAQF